MMKIGATKPVMKDTRPILKECRGRGRDESAKRENLDYNESIYCDMYRGRTDGAVERVGRIAVKMWTFANFSRDRRRRSSTHAPHVIKRRNSGAAGTAITKCEIFAVDPSR